MNYETYGVLTAIQLIFTGLAFIFAPFIALFANSDGYLPNWLIWFQTQDNSLDEGWRGTYFGTPVNPAPTGTKRWWYRTRWLWRNPAYGFCYYPLGMDIIPADWIIDEYKVNDFGDRILLKAHTKDGHFCYTDSRGWKLGWKIWSNFRGLDKDGKPLWSDKPWGPKLRTSICFSVPNPFKKK
jgi:hypothetical protein